MSSFFEQVFQLLTSNPGSLAYHLVLAFSIAGAFQASLMQWRRQNAPELRRLAAGLGLLLAVRLGLFAAAALSWQGFLGEVSILAPLDRTVTVISLILIVWLWAFPAPQRLADAATLLLAVLGLAFASLAFTWWVAQSQPMEYNGSWMDTVGEALSLLIILLGILALVIRRPQGWGLGFGMLALLFAGHAFHLLSPQPGGDFPGAVRLAQVAAYGLLFALPQRFSLPAEGPDSTRPANTSSRVDPRALDLLLQMAGPLENPAQEIARLAAQLLKADACLVVAVPSQPGPMTVLGGWQRDKDQKLEAPGLNGSLSRTLANAIRRGRPVRLPSASTAGDDMGLGAVLGRRELGPVMAVPFPGLAGPGSVGIIVLSPFSNYSWTGPDQAYLSSITESLARLAGNAGSGREAGGEYSTHNSRQDLERRLAQLEQENKANLLELEESRRQVSSEFARAESLAALLSSQEEALEATGRLRAELRQLKEVRSSSLSLPEKDSEHLEGELRLALQEIAHLRSALSEADRKALAAADLPGALSDQGEHVQEIASISQELRQPMSSILGYTDLLMAESVGILGALQRKFLERIRASTERMGSLVDDLIQLAALHEEQSGLKPQNVDLNHLMDEAIALTMGQMREKNIILRVDIRDHLPPIQADRDALQQILIHLLQNASSATPHEGEVSIVARVREENGQQDYVLLQVSDWGGGIQVEDLPRVFSRLYRAENTTIPGLGDTGIGLSIVKSLVEAHRGRIWVDSEQEKGSTFSVLLPVAAAAPQGNGRRESKPV